MDLTSNADPKDVRTILLEVGSALVFRGEARYDWKHRIRACLSDDGVPRQRRLSLTFRTSFLLQSLNSQRRERWAVSFANACHQSPMDHASLIGRPRRRARGRSS